VQLFPTWEHELAGVATCCLEQRRRPSFDYLRSGTIASSISSYVKLPFRDSLDVIRDHKDRVHLYVLVPPLPG
jgi:hypothetical protein